MWSIFLSSIHPINFLKELGKTLALEWVVSLLSMYQKDVIYACFKISSRVRVHFMIGMIRLQYCICCAVSEPMLVPIPIHMPFCPCYLVQYKILNHEYMCFCFLTRLLKSPANGISKSLHEFTHAFIFWNISSGTSKIWQLLKLSTLIPWIM